ncbi:MAG: tetratricopeptide repeat protein [Syntrophomonadaceae bacterium]
MKFLDWIVSLLSNKPRSRRKSTVPKVHIAVPEITEKKTDAMSCFKSGIRNFSSAEYNAAMEDFSQAISIRKNFHQAFYNRGLTRLKIDDNQGANLDFTRAIEIHPVYAKAYLNRGIAKNRLGDPEGAQEDFNKSVKIDPALYPLFTVRKIQTETTEQIINSDAPAGKQENAGNRDESQRTDAPEEPESAGPLNSEIVSDAEDFMKALVLESLKDEFSSQSPLPEAEEVIISPSIQVTEENDFDNRAPESSEETNTEEYSFQELTSEEEQDELPAAGAAAPEEEEITKGKSAGDDTAEEEAGGNKGKEPVLYDEIPDLPKSFIVTYDDENEKDDYSKNYVQEEAEKAGSDKYIPSAPIEVENEAAGLQSLKPKPLESEIIQDNYKKNTAVIDTPDEDHPEDDLKKYNFSETGMSDEEIHQIFLTGEDFDEEEESQLSSDIPEPPKAVEKQSRRAAKTPNDPAEEARMLSEIDKADPDFTVELPEQSEVKRILAESLPETRLNYARGFYSRAEQKLQEGDKAGAMLDFSNAIEFYPKFSQAYLQRGNIEAELNELTDAIADYSKAIEYHHKNPAAYYKRAMANQKSENNREALADFTKAILFEPRNPKLYLFRGILRYKMGQARAAFSDWSRAELLGSPQARELLHKYALKLKNSKK